MKLLLSLVCVVLCSCNYWEPQGCVNPKNGKVMPATENYTEQECKELLDAFIQTGWYNQLPG